MAADGLFSLTLLGTSLNPAQRTLFTLLSCHIIFGVFRTFKISKVDTYVEERGLAMT
jgi:hypothetical protein